jgi:hypothetical protein
LGLESWIPHQKHLFKKFILILEQLKK